MQVCKAKYNPRSLFHHQSEIQPDMSPLKVRIPQKEVADLSWQGGCGRGQPYAKDRACFPSSSRHLLHCKGRWLREA